MSSMTNKFATAITGKLHAYEKMSDIINYLQNPVHYQNTNKLKNPTDADIIFSLPIGGLNANIKKGKENEVIFNNLPDSTKLALDIMLMIKKFEKKNRNENEEERNQKRKQVINSAKPTIDALIEYEAEIRRDNELQNGPSFPMVENSDMLASLRTGGKKFKKSKKSRKSKKSKKSRKL